VKSTRRGVWIMLEHAKKNFKIFLQKKIFPHFWKMSEIFFFEKQPNRDFVQIRWPLWFLVLQSCSRAHSKAQYAYFQMNKNDKPYIQSRGRLARTARANTPHFPHFDAFWGVLEPVSTFAVLGCMGTGSTSNIPFGPPLEHTSTSWIVKSNRKGVWIMLEHAKKKFQNCFPKKFSSPIFQKYRKKIFLKNNQTEILFKLNDHYEFFILQSCSRAHSKAQCAYFQIHKKW